VSTENLQLALRVGQPSATSCLVHFNPPNSRCGTQFPCTRESVPRWGWVARLILVILLAVNFSACGMPRKDRIVIGSKNFSGQVIFGELIAPHLERRKGMPGDRRFFLAGTYICPQAVLARRIDLYVQDTGAALTTVL